MQEKVSGLTFTVNMSIFDEFLSAYCSCIGRLNGNYLNTIGVNIDPDVNDFKGRINKEEPNMIEPPKSFDDYSDDYDEELEIVKAYREKMQFEDFFAKHLKGIVFFIGVETDSKKYDKIRRSIRENVSSVIYLIKSICGTETDALSIYLCFYIFFHLENLNLRSLSYHNYERKTLARAISSEDLNDEEFIALSILLDEMKKSAITHNKSNGFKEYSSKPEFFDYYIKAMQQNNCFDFQNILWDIYSKLESLKLV